MQVMSTERVCESNDEVLQFEGKQRPSHYGRFDEDLAQPSFLTMTSQDLYPMCFCVPHRQFPVKRINYVSLVVSQFISVKLCNLMKLGAALYCIHVYYPDNVTLSEYTWYLLIVLLLS